MTQRIALTSVLDLDYLLIQLNIRSVGATFKLAPHKSNWGIEQMNLTYAMQGTNAIEAQMNADAATTSWLDALMQIEAPTKATPMFLTSDCCGSNNEPQ